MPYYQQVWMLEKMLVVIGTVMMTCCLATAAPTPASAVNSQLGSVCITPATFTSNSESCPWTYLLHVDETRSPAVLIVAQCLSASDQCETVDAEVRVQRRSSTAGQVHEVTERFAVACRPKLTRPSTPEPADNIYNPVDYSN